ncbi:hypothetical protein [Microvirga splendida]|uniref:J domain-containing protein n=1 Tax=Microvirga splendida TaxID=2795727 RepID=A0ABS0XWA5_9HYPH|nr:hypothetical protein [Microvirga splendida]MBJ6124038.1 hypothetical protein [Microvirga splendida]
MRVFVNQIAVAGWKLIEPRLDAILASPRTLRIAIMLGSFLMIVKWPVLSGLLLWGSVIWAVPLLISDRREAVRLRAACQSTEAQAEALRSALIFAQGQISHLEQQLQEAKERQGREGKGHPVFRRVGLDEAAPDFVIRAVHKAYRKALHPDGKSQQHRVEADRRFREMEQVFSEIRRLQEWATA